MGLPSEAGALTDRTDQSEGRACYLECDTHDSPSLGIKFEVVQEFGDGHGTLSLAGGSAVGLSATGAWRILTSLGGAAVGDEPVYA